MSENVSSERTCPKCGARLAADTVEGLCPACLLALNLATQTELTGEVGPGGTRKVPLPPKSPPSPAEIASQFPQFEILECLGRGGMGVVYKARQKSLERLVALKILAPEREKDPQFAERFAREAKILAQLNHPSIVTVHDFGEAGGMFYLVMEFVDGMNLRHLLRERKLSPEEALAIVPPVCEALQYAHGQGVIHRDIKPENLLLDRQGRIKIADFGIAKILGRAASSRPAEPARGATSAPPSSQETAITKEQVIGTPQYMAPEQTASPEKVDHRADIYSLGVVLYEMLTGELPAAKLQPPSKKVQVDVRIDEIVLHALEKEPEKRYQSAAQFKTVVETIAESQQRSEEDVRRRSGTSMLGAESRFSRTAIVAAAWLAFSIIVELLFALDHAQAHGRAVGPSEFTLDLQHLSLLKLLLLGVMTLAHGGIIGGTVLGWVAVFRIRRSQGRLRGLELALFCGLLVPLLALDAGIFLLGALIVEFLQEVRINTSRIMPALSFVGSLAADFFIVRAAWRALNKPFSNSEGRNPQAKGDHPYASGTPASASETPSSPAYISTVIIGLLIAAVWGFFADLRGGEVGWFLARLVFVPLLAVGLHWLVFRFFQTKARAWLLVAAVATLIGLCAVVMLRIGNRGEVLSGDQLVVWQEPSSESENAVAARGPGGVSSNRTSGPVAEALADLESRVGRVRDAEAAGRLLEVAGVLDEINEICDFLQGKNQNTAPSMQEWGIRDAGRFNEIRAALAGLENAAEGLRSIAQGRQGTEVERAALAQRVWDEQFLPRYRQLTALLPTSPPLQAIVVPAGVNRAQLPNGTEVELTAVAHTKDGRTTWWNADGSPLETPPGTVMVPPNVERRMTNDFFGLVVRIPRDGGYRIFELNPPPTRSNSGEVRRDGVETGDIPWIFAYSDPLKPVPERITCRFGVAIGDPRTVARFDGTSVTVTGLTARVRFQTPARDGFGGTALRVGCPPELRDYFLIARAQQKNGQWIQGFDPSNTIGTPERQFHFSNVRPPDVKEYVVEFVPWFWIEFRDIALKPQFSLARTEAAFENAALRFEAFSDTMEKTTNGAAALRLKDDFMVAIHALADQLRGTEVEVPEWWMQTLQTIREALQAGDLARAKRLFDSISTEDDDWEERVLRFFEKQRQTAEAVQSPTAPSSLHSTATFGPVIERVIHDCDENNGSEALHLRTGRLSSIPTGITTNRATMDEWFNTNQMNLLVDFARNRWALMVKELKLAGLDGKRWEELRPEEVRQRLQADVSGLERLERNGQRYYLLSEGAKPPLLFGFQTDDGDVGVLQITGFTENPRGVKVRYRLAPNEGDTSNQSPRPLHGARLIAERWLETARAGRNGELRALTSPPSSADAGLGVARNANALRVISVLGNSETAMAVSTRVRDNLNRERVAQFSLIASKGAWLVREATLESPEDARRRIEGFSRNPRVQFDVRREDLVGAWTEVNFAPATYVLAEDGTMTMGFRDVGNVQVTLPGTWQIQGDRFSFTTERGQDGGIVRRIEEDQFAIERSNRSGTMFHRMTNEARASVTQSNQPSVSSSRSQGDLNFGLEALGLRVAVELIPSKRSYAAGEPIQLRFHVRNGRRQNVTLSGETWFQHVDTVIEDSTGQQIKPSYKRYSGLPRTRETLVQPGHVAVFESSGIALLAPDDTSSPGHPVGRYAKVPPGRYVLRFRLSDHLRVQDEKGAFENWPGSAVLETGPVTIEVVEAESVDSN